MIKNKQKLLLCIPPILCISMILIFPFLTNTFGKTIGYFGSFLIYWFAFCILSCILLLHKDGGLKQIYSQKNSAFVKYRILYYILAFTPCIATFFVVFKEFVFKSNFTVLVFTLIFALINGIIEEMFWRGLFNKIFNNNMLLAYIYPTLFFGIWHIALYFVKGVSYQGGFASLVGGAFFMGILWGWVVFKTKSIKIVTMAHVITNFFAFIGLIYENWFM